MKAVAALAVSAPRACEVMLSGRLARVAGVRDEFARRLARVMAGVPVHVLAGFAATAKQAAQGAALIADGLAGGASAALVEALGIREASRHRARSSVRDRAGRGATRLAMGLQPVSALALHARAAS